MSGVGRRCERCQQLFRRRKSESNYAYSRRPYCSARCERIAKPVRQLGLNREVWREMWEAMK